MTGFTLILLALPGLYIFHPARASWKNGLYVFLVLHIFYLAYLFFAPQPNIFTALNVPLSIPTARLRSLLTDLNKSSGNASSLPDHLDRLLKRLNEREIRALYVRLGHTALTCQFCVDQTEFMLYALPQTLLAYVLEAAVVGIVCGSFSPTRVPYSWLLEHDASGVVPRLLSAIRNPTPNTVRNFLSWALAIGMLLEAYTVLSVDIIIRDGPGNSSIMWHDVLTKIRLGVFTLLPLVAYTILSFSANAIPPSTPKPSDTQETREGTDESQPLNPTLPHLISIHNHLRFLRLLYPAIIRNDAANERATNRMSLETEVGRFALTKPEGEDEKQTIEVLEWFREVIPPEDREKSDEELLKVLKENAKNTVGVLTKGVGL